jgi:sulfatase maturation enzyme AslB (radical SAM superfamily)
MYNFDGDVKNCIRSAEVLGNIKDNTIEEIVLGDNNNIRQSMMVNKIHPLNCRPCLELEYGKNSFDIISDRKFYIRELKHVPLDTYKTVPNFDLHTIDVRWTNLCNFACTYCGPRFSSKWADELKVEQEVPSEEQRQAFKEYIFKHASQLKHVYLAGGEPLLMKENLELLDLLDPDVNLRINTNLSKVDTQVFDRICKFKNVHWIVSVETIEEEYEYVRYGGKWLDFLDNLNTINQLNHKISFNMLHFILNYQSIFGCVDYFKDLGFHNNSFIIGPLLTPEYLNIRHLPDSVLQSVKEILEKRISDKPGYLLEDSYKNMLNYIQQPIKKDFLGSLDQLYTLDQRRNLDSSKIFKDLYNIKETYHGNY